MTATTLDAAIEVGRIADQIEWCAIEGYPCAAEAHFAELQSAMTELGAAIAAGKPAPRPQSLRASYRPESDDPGYMSGFSA